jgi:hypothetical protein
LIRLGAWIYPSQGNFHRTNGEDISRMQTNLLKRPTILQSPARDVPGEKPLGSRKKEAFDRIQARVGNPETALRAGADKTPRNVDGNNLRPPALCLPLLREEPDEFSPPKRKIF